MFCKSYIGNLKLLIKQDDMRIKIHTTAIICLLVAILIHLAAAIDIRDTFAAGPIMDATEKRMGDFSDLLSEMSQV